jgi:hypothetical protein
LENIKTRDIGSSDFGRALKSPSTRIEDDFSFLEKLNNHSQTINQFNTRSDKVVPLVSKIGLDLAFSKIGSVMMILKSVLSFLISDEDASNNKKTTFLKVIDDLAFKVRQQCQYSIHAQPGMDIRKPDDIASDMVHNMQAAKLGTFVYHYNAFVAPWLGLLKVFFPYSDNPLFGLVPRMIDFADTSIVKLTNLFWNLRRITKSLVPYDGGIRSESLFNKQSEVRKLMGFYWKNFFINPYNAIVKYFLKDKSTSFEIPQSQIDFYDRYEIREIQAKTIDDYLKNWRALFSSRYFSVHEGKNIKIGDEEPENSNIYVRSKILSQVLGIWAGGFGAVLNSASIATGFISNFFNLAGMRKISEGLTNQANALMSLVYLTGEVPANINEYFKKKKLGIANANYNLLVAGIGALGMLNRIKLNPICRIFLNAIKLKPFLDKWDRLFKNFFLLFFSANRWILHYDEKLVAIKNSSNYDNEYSKKHDNLWKHLTLPFRVLIKDSDVVYTEDEILNKKSNANKFKPIGF